MNNYINVKTYFEIYNWTFKLEKGINYIDLNETISCKKGFMILLKSIKQNLNLTITENQSQIIYGERNILSSKEDLKLISMINNSLIFDSNSSRIMFRFCIKLKIIRYSFSYSNNFKIYFPDYGIFSIKASVNNNYSTIYETNYDFTTVIVKINPISVIDTYSTVATKKNDINTDQMMPTLAEKLSDSTTVNSMKNITPIPFDSTVKTEIATSTTTTNNSYSIRIITNTTRIINLINDLKKSTTTSKTINTSPNTINNSKIEPTFITNSTNFMPVDLNENSIDIFSSTILTSNKINLTDIYYIQELNSTKNNFRVKISTVNFWPTTISATHQKEDIIIKTPAINLMSTFNTIGSPNETITHEMAKEIINLFKTTNSTDLNGCLSSCSNRGLCKINSQSNQFYCECFEGFGGKSCQIDLRPCSLESTCINNSTCTNIKQENNYDSEGNQMYSFECICLAHYFGDHCENKEKICLNKTCSYHGLCVDSNNQAKCNCFKYYSGNDCEIKSETLITFEKSKKSTVIISIFIIFFLLAIFPLNDIINIYMKFDDLIRKAKKKINRPMRIKVYRLYYKP